MQLLFVVFEKKFRGFSCQCLSICYRNSNFVTICRDIGYTGINIAKFNTSKVQVIKIRQNVQVVFLRNYRWVLWNLLSLWNLKFYLPLKISFPAPFLAFGYEELLFSKCNSSNQTKKGVGNKTDKRNNVIVHLTNLKDVGTNSTFYANDKLLACSFEGNLNHNLIN